MSSQVAILGTRVIFAQNDFLKKSSFVLEEVNSVSVFWEGVNSTGDS